MSTQAVGSADVRVMLVDDSSMMRSILRSIVENVDGFSVVAEAEDGIDALARLHESAVDVILLDIEMPRMDGLSFLAASRVITVAPIIVVSSVVYPMSAILVRALRLGADDVVPKPSGVVSLDMEASRGAALVDALLRAGRSKQQ
jgi:two-component system, chemotaxis family, protein-glutamate methylesterase/glutaminase